MIGLFYSILAVQGRRIKLLDPATKGVKSELFCSAQLFIEAFLLTKLQYSSTANFSPQTNI